MKEMMHHDDVALDICELAGEGRLLIQSTPRGKFSRLQECAFGEICDMAKNLVPEQQPQTYHQKIIKIK